MYVYKTGIINEALALFYIFIINEEFVKPNSK